MTAWASMLIPAGSVVVGAVIAGGAAFGGQVLTHRGSFQREREARRDAFTVARFETERETLLGLQESLLEHVQLVILVAALADVGETEKAAEKVEDVVLSELKITMLTSRCLAREAVEAVNDCLDQCKAVALTPGPMGTSSTPDPSASFDHAQELLGLALRQDPFENDR